MKFLLLQIPLYGIGFGAPIATQYVIPSFGAQYFLVVNPVVIDGKFLGVGKCYEIKDDGNFEKIWQIEGDYSFSNNLFLSREGNILIKIVDVYPTKDKADLEKKSALEFYEKGKLVKRVNVADIVDPAKLEISSFPSDLPTYEIIKFDEPIVPKIGTLSYFDYFDENDRDQINKKSKNGAQIFCIKTTQSEVLAFEVADGSLIYRKKLK